MKCCAKNDHDKNRWPLVTIKYDSGKDPLLLTTIELDGDISSGVQAQQLLPVAGNLLPWK